MNDEKRFNDDSALKKETENDLKISQDDISTSSTSLSSRGSSMPLKKNLTPTKETKAKHVESASTSKTKSNTTTKSKTSTSALPTKVSSSSSSSTPRADSTQKVKTTSPPPSSKKSVSLEPKSKPPPYSEPPSLQEREKPLIPSAPTSISGNTPIVSFTEKVEKETESSPHHPSVEISIATSITSSSSDSGSMDPDNLPIYTAVTQEEAEDVRPVTFVKRPATARKPPPKLKSEAVDKGPTTSSVGVPLVDANPEEDMFITANSSIVEPLKYTKSDDSSITKDDLINLRDQIQTLTRCIHPLGKLLDYVQEDMDMMNKEIEKWKAASNDYLQTLITEMEVTKGKLGPMEEELKKIDESIALELEKLDQVKMRVLMNEETMRTLVSQLVVSSH
ncbi:hypothetical protein HMI54_009554 [Coelomomyces lativittatus]|nr:hypothetical protein HMI56_000887 [Coelomomyces lativittatus]KAJ1518727.1 hypothetical protein HMI54_009554 [Coelomomyces lativittatus]